MGGYSGGPSAPQMIGSMGPGGGQYPGYGQQGGQMYGMDQSQMMTQAGAAWGQNAYGMQQQQYRPGMPNGPPQASPAFRQQHPNFPTASEAAMTQQQQQLMGYPGASQGQPQQQHYANPSQMSSSGSYSSGGAPMSRNSQAFQNRSHKFFFASIVLSSGTFQPIYGTMVGSYWKSLRPTCTLAHINGWNDAVALNGIEFVYKC